MASKAVMDAVSSRLAYVWGYTPIKEPNRIAKVPADASAFLYVEYPTAIETLVSIGDPGNNLYREEGGIRFILAGEAGAGIDTYAGWIESLRDAFRSWQEGNLLTFEAGPAIVNDANANGAYFEMSFSVEYRFDKFA